jgi:hypothetical protein
VTVVWYGVSCVSIESRQRGSSECEYGDAMRCGGMMLQQQEEEGRREEGG